MDGDLEIPKQTPKNNYGRQEIFGLDLAYKFNP